MNRLLNYIEQDGPRAFSKALLESHPDLFAERAALFYTPTSQIPERYVGRGSLDVTLPVSLPSWLEFLELRGLNSPRFWVDQLQRATGFIRWVPVDSPARVRFTSRNTAAYAHHLVIKTALDALKLGTAGRRDGVRLHYFGAIADDSQKHISGFDIVEEVSAALPASCRVQVCSLGDVADTATSTHQVVLLDEA